MRFTVILAGAVALLASAPALAGAAAAPKGDPYAIPQMVVTNVADFDSFFTSANQPISDVITARKNVDMAEGNFKTEMKIAETASIDDAVKELKNKINGKAHLLITAGKIPTLSPADAIPDDAKHAVDAYNALVKDLQDASDKLEATMPAINDASTKAADIVAHAPDTIKNSGLPATKIPGALTATKKDGSIVAGSKDDATKLGQSLASFTTTVTSTLGS